MSETTPQETVTAESAAEVKERRASVASVDLIEAWMNGVAAGQTRQEIADDLGMEKASLQQRVYALKKQGVTLPNPKDEARGGKRTDISALQALVAKLNSELEIPADESDESEGDSDES